MIHCPRLNDEGYHSALTVTERDHRKLLMIGGFSGHRRVFYR